MSNTAFINDLKNGMSVDSDENIFESIWSEYERVILESLITSFGLDFIVKDQHGGDVDTIHNVREINKDTLMQYKNVSNQKAYENLEKYDNAAYHKDKRYKDVVKVAKKEFDEKGTWIEDTYVKGNTVAPKSNKTIPRNRQGQLDHVISASEIHKDPGRVLAGLDGMDLANNPDNLRYTNADLNRNMSDKSIEEYIKWCEENPDKVNCNGKKGEPLPEEVKDKLRKEYNRAKKNYDAKLARSYYTSPRFVKDTAMAAGQRGVEMGLRQVLGFVFMEVWICTKNEMQSIPAGSELKDMLEAVGRGVKRGFQEAKEKYKDLIVKFGEGILSGTLASLSTTICNIFFTTAKNIVKCIRQVWASVVQAGKVLLFNPDELMFGDRIKATTVILATGASVLVGTAVGELIEKTPIGTVPVIGGIVRTFCSSLVSGLLSCTLLIFLDRSRIMNSLIYELNRIPSEVSNYAEIADAFERIAAKLSQIDIELFRKETSKYKNIANLIAECQSEEELNTALLQAYKTFDIKIPWEDDFNSFMGNKSNKLVFS